MKLFREDNTGGYTAEQMDALNKEWDARATELELEEYTDEYNAAAQQFCDDVSRRRVDRWIRIDHKFYQQQ